MRVLIIGGTGFIGPHVVRLLVQAGHEVTVFHRGEHEPDLPAGVRHIHSASAAIPVIDLPAEVRSKLRNAAPDVVLHMIAMGEADAQRLMETFRGVAKRVVVLSSGDVYRAYSRVTGAELAAPDRKPLNEESPLRKELYPYRQDGMRSDDWRYHYEKILAERVVVSNPALPATVLRLPAVYGPGDDKHRLFPYVKRMDDKRPAILIGTGQAGWRWTHGYVEDVAAAIALAVTDEKAAGRIYNVGEENTPTVAARVRLLGRVADWRGQLLFVPRRFLPAHLKDKYNYRQDMVLDTTRIRRELGWRESFLPEEALRRTIEWERENAAVGDAAQFDYEAEDAVMAGIS
jgi:nucleoside-diphosphate-sugar epimerase